MKRTSVSIMVLALSAGLLLGGCKGGSQGEGRAPGAASEVKATTPDGLSLAALMDEMEKQAGRLEEQMKLLQRKARLARERVFDFNLAGAPSKGPDKAKLTMVVFSDFQCPFCRRFAQASKRLLKEFPDDLRLVFINFPLNNQCNSALNRPFHQKACIAAEAGMAAAAQGKFWEMHDYLFANQRSFTPDTIAAFADSHGMDGAAIKDAIETGKYKARIMEQARQLMPTGSRGTPTVFINGMMVKNARWDDLQSSSSFIEELLNPKKAEKEIPAAAKVVANPEQLPPARVVLEDGTLLEDRLKNLRDRLSKINLAPQRRMPARPKGPDPAKVYKFDLSGSPFLGHQNAPVTVVVFSEFLCPHCAKLAPELKAIHNRFPDKVKIVFKNLPNRGHQFSLQAHEAAMAAQAQGKFWEMHDLIFQNRTRINPEELKNLARQAGLDMDKYEEDVTKHHYRGQLIKDISDANRASITGTPSVFINGKYQRDSGKQAIIAVIEKLGGPSR